METFTKDSLIKKLKEIKKLGWVENGRFGNHGGIGNTLEDFLGIKENNLPIPNAREWELKTQRKSTGSLITLFHCEPSPRALKIVPSILLPNYGWTHKFAGKKYPKNEKSFRQTITTTKSSDRGFIVKVDRKKKQVLISFDHTKVTENHAQWIKDVKKKIGLKDIETLPYWGFEDLKHKVGTKLLNCFFVRAEVKKEGSKEYFWYNQIKILKGFSFEKFLNTLEAGVTFVDFDARTGHNHGTKFRIKQNSFSDLYSDVINIE